MKKWVSILLTMIVILTSMSLPIVAEDIDGTILESEDLELQKMEMKSPCYTEYEIDIDENQYSTMEVEEKDLYESNNSFLRATKLNSKPEGRPTDFSLNVAATLHRETWFFGLIERNIDEDYYRVDLFGNAEVDIFLNNIPTGCDYDLKLYTHDNIIDSKEDDISMVSYSSRASNRDESISVSLTPGTYYIWIYPYTDECDDSTNYNLSIDVDYTAQLSFISSLKYNKGAKAALWVSDYDPCGIAPCSTTQKEVVGYLATSDTVIESTFENPFTEYFTTRDPIEQTVLYIWDTDLRIELRNVLLEIKNEIEAELENNKKYLIAWEIVDTVIGESTTAVSILISFFDSSSPTVGVLDVACTAIPIVSTLAQNLFAPDEDAIETKEELLDRLENICIALETSEDSEGDEVLRISSTYTYSVDYVTPTLTYYYFDFTPVSQNSFIFDSVAIDYWSVDSIVTGTTYGIIDDESFENAIVHGNNTLPDVNTSDIRTLQLNSSISRELKRGEYHWYKFTAPSSGTYSFYTENSFDTYGELFAAVVPARSTTGLLAYGDDDEMDYSILDFTIEYDLSAGETVYLRVRGSGWTANGTYALRATKVS